MAGARHTLTILLATAIATHGIPAAARQSPQESTEVAQAFYHLTGTAPMGFAHLAGPYRALVDLYFGDRRIASMMSRYTADTIAFDDPAAIVKALPQSTDPTSLEDALSGTLATNADALCNGSPSDDCRTLDPEQAAVIFDEERLRADIVVNPRLLSTRPVLTERFLPPPDNGFSLLQNFRAAAAGSNRSDTLFSLGSFTTLAYGDSRLVSQATYTDQDAVTFDSLYAQRDARDMEYRAGIFRTSGRGLSFAAAQDLAGIHVATTLNTRTDLGFAYGTPISVALASRARVDILKDGRLVTSRFFEAGNHMLDTSSLPEGAYDIVIRINENGRVREEVRFFSKSTRVPPMDQPLFTFEAGAVMDRSADSTLPENTGEWIGRVGYSRRLTPTFGFDTGVATTGEEQLLEIGAFQIDSLPGSGGDYYQLEAATFAGSDRRFGFRLQGHVRLRDIYATADFRKVVHDESDLAQVTDDILLPGASTVSNVTLQFPLLGGFASLTATESRRSGTEDVSRQSLTYRRMLKRSGRTSIEFKTDLTFEDGDTLALIGIRLFSHRNRWTMELSPRYRYDDLPPDAAGHSYQLDASSRFDHPDFAGGEAYLSASGTSYEQGDSASIGLGYRNLLLHSDFSADHLTQNGSSESRWTAALATSLLGSPEAWQIGAQNTSDAAILVSLDGSSPDTDFEVLVDGYRRGYARGGRTTALLLPGYEQYDIAIRPRQSAFVAFDDTSRRVTLYPGSVVSLAWAIQSLYVVVGQLVDTHGNPVPHARLTNAFGYTGTDENGYFQGEIAAADSEASLTFFTNGNDASCTVTVPLASHRNGIVFAEPLTCVPAPASLADQSAIEETFRLATP